MAKKKKARTRKPKPEAKIVDETTKEEKPKHKGAPSGNHYWMIRDKHGRDMIYPTPELLWKEINAYFEWCIAHPWMKAVLHQKSVTVVEVPVARVYTLEGMCCFLDMSVSAFKLYEGRKDFVAVTTRAREIIANQKFEGAAGGFFNANIIARDLGLKDKSEIEHAGSVAMLPILNVGMKVHKAKKEKKKK